MHGRALLCCDASLLTCSRHSVDGVRLQAIFTQLYGPSASHTVLTTLVQFGQTAWPDVTELIGTAGCRAHKERCCLVLVEIMHAAVQVQT